VNVIVVKLSAEGGTVRKGGGGPVPEAETKRKSHVGSRKVSRERVYKEGSGGEIEDAVA